LISDEDSGHTGTRRALLEAARGLGHHDSQAVLRTLAVLRDNLPPEVRLQIAMMLDWAREGLNHSAGDVQKPELTALGSAYAHARDVLLASVIKERG